MLTFCSEQATTQTSFTFFPLEENANLEPLTTSTTGTLESIALVAEPEKYELAAPLPFFDRAIVNQREVVPSMWPAEASDKPGGLTKVEQILHKEMGAKYDEKFAWRVFQSMIEMVEVPLTTSWLYLKPLVASCLSHQLLGIESWSCERWEAERDVLKILDHDQYLEDLLAPLKNLPQQVSLKSMQYIEAASVKVNLEREIKNNLSKMVRKVNNGNHKLEVILDGVSLLVYETVFAHVGLPKLQVIKHQNSHSFRITHFIEQPSDLVDAGFRGQWYLWRFSHIGVVQIKFYDWDQRNTFFRKQGDIPEALKQRMVSFSYNTRAERLIFTAEVDSSVNNPRGH
jgi:hypothetical protein